MSAEFDNAITVLSLIEDDRLFTISERRFLNFALGELISHNMDIAAR
jgi:hypothetical protein